MKDHESIERSFEKSEIHNELIRSGLPMPPRHARQGKKIKRARFWERDKKPTSKAPKGFLKSDKKIDPIKSLFGFK